jgi:hypothetical protein
MISAVAIALYFHVDFTEPFLFKLVMVGLPLSVPFAIALLLVLWKRKRGQDGVTAALALRTIAALVTFELGILGSLMWFAVYDKAVNRANAVRYKETSCRIKVGMTKGEVIELAGSPDTVSRGKDGEELWWWQSRDRWKHPTEYNLIGKSPYQGGPFRTISFDSSERVASVDTWR